PAIWNVRESEPWSSYFDYLHPDVSKMAYDAFCYPYRIVFVANSTRHAWAPLDTHHNFTVVRNGLDLDRMRRRTASYERTSLRAALGLGADELAIVLLGTVCERKGQVDLIRALGAMSPTLWPRMRVFIVGDRPSEYSHGLHAEHAQLPEALGARVRIE